MSGAETPLAKVSCTRRGSEEDEPREALTVAKRACRVSVSNGQDVADEGPASEASSLPDGTRFYDEGGQEAAGEDSEDGEEGVGDMHENEGLDGGECGANDDGQGSFCSGPIIESHAAFADSLEASYGKIDKTLTEVHRHNICVLHLSDEAARQLTQLTSWACLVRSFKRKMNFSQSSCTSLNRKHMPTKA
jgi:hypothetical protein